MARKAFNPSDEQRHWVIVMSRNGMHQEDIATEVGLRSPKTLRKHFREELDRGRIGANVRVGQTLFNMAVSGKHVSATIHWLNRADWQSKQQTRPAMPDFVVALDKEAA